MGIVSIIKFTLASIVVGLAFLNASGLRTFDFLQKMEQNSYVTRMLLSQPSGAAQNVVLVTIDDASLNEVGPWPWPSTTLQTLVKNLASYYNAQAIGLDLATWQPTTRDTPVAVGDWISTNTVPILQGYQFAPKRVHGLSTSRLPIQPAPIDKPALARANIRTVHAYYGMSPIELKSIAGYGFLNTNRAHANDLVQSLPLFQRYRDEFYEALPLAMLRAIYDIKAYNLDFVPENIRPSSVTLPTEIDLGENFHIPIDREGNVVMPSPAYDTRVLRLSARDVLNKNVPRELLNNRITIVGVTTPNLLTFPERANNNYYSQSALHANLLAYIVDKRYRSVPSEARVINLLVLAMLSVTLIWTYTRLKPVGTIFLTGLCLLSLLVAHDYVWNELELALPITEQLLLVLLIPSVFITINLIEGMSRRRKVAQLFRHAVSPEVVRILSQQKRVLPSLGETKTMSVLSCSIRGYHAITEKTSPYQVARLTNQYLHHVNSSLFRHRGTLESFRYDHVTAFWGAPLRDPDHAANAVAAALDIQSQLPMLNRQFLAWGWKPVRLGIGLHSSQFNIANFGPAANSQYNIYGNELNIVYWLEQLSKHYGVNIIVSGSIQSAAPEFRYIELDRVRYSRSAPPISLYEPIIRADQTTPAIDCEIHAYHEALESFHARQWSLAKKQFSELIVHYSGRLLYQMYLSRCYQFEQKPPRDEWDGIVFHPLKSSSI